MLLQSELLKSVVQNYSEAQDTDVLYFNGNVTNSELFLPKLLKRQKRTNLLLILVTYGGNPHEAYRFARAFQSAYLKFSILLPGPCKSAGTLMATGAHEIIMDACAELGPLDIQLAIKDDFVNRESASTMNRTFDALSDEALSIFVKVTRELLLRTGHVISLETIADTGIRITQGLCRPIYDKIDPRHVGEVSKALEISKEYATRLAGVSVNISEQNIDKLIHGYPSHEFVIDGNEASMLFRHVRKPDELEESILEVLKYRLLVPSAKDEDSEFLFVS